MILEKTKLKKLLAKVNAFVSKDLVTTTPPRVLFQAKDGKVNVTSCNGTDFGRFSFETEDRTEMEFVIDVKNFSRMASLRGDASIEFESDCVEIKNGDTKMVFPAQTVDTYPLQDYALETDNRIEVKSEDLKKCIGKVSYCRNEKDTRLFVTGILLTFDGKTLKAEGTDSIRIMDNSIGLPEDKGFQFEGILNSKAIGVIENLDDGKDVKIGMDGVSVCVEDDDNLIYVSLINAKYPDLSKLFKVNETATFTLDKNQVLESLTLFSQSENKSVIIDGEGDKLTFHQEDGVSEIKDCIPLEDFKGEHFNFCVDIDLFREIFQNMKEGSSKMKFVFNQPLEPVKVYDEEQLVGIIQPMEI